MIHHLVRSCFLSTVFLMLFLSAGFSFVKLPAVFSDHMVLQQKAKVQFWGWADPGEIISISPGWSAKTIAAKTNVSGEWKLSVPTPSAGGPYKIKIKGHNSIVLKDVLVGEVWVCSGQSNMGFSLKSSENAATEIERANFPSIRYFSVERQYGRALFNDCPGSVWEKTTPETAGSFSAVAYYFAKKLRKDVDVPVGIIYAAWGGTPAEAWTPEGAFQNDAILSLYPERWKEIQENVGKDSVAYLQALKEWKKSNQTSKKTREPKTYYYFKRPWREPGVLFNGMINPVIPYSVKGVLWYQGESNVAYAGEYYRLFSTMINNWRRSWNMSGNKNFPFYFVQIAPFGYSNMEAAAKLRQAQFEVMKKLKRTGMAVTVDLGNMKDIHPRKKKEVGERLALIALAKDYGFKKITFAGPLYQKVVTKKDKVHVKFDQKLLIPNGNQIKGFELGYKVEGSNSLMFVEAEAKIENNEVVIKNSKLKAPDIVRYAWLHIGEANLMNKELLPAYPFRSLCK